MADAELVNIEIAEAVDEGVEEAPLRPNPCEGLQTFLANQQGNGALLAAATLATRLSDAAAKVRGAFAAPALGRDYSAVDVLEVRVSRASAKGAYELATRARFEGCDVDLRIGGGSLVRSCRDLEWLRGCLREAYPGCVVPPVTSDVYGEWSAEAAERFLAQCLAHAELSKAPELACFCVSDASELSSAEAAFGAAAGGGASAASPLHVRWGAVVLDVVGNDTAVGAEALEGAPEELAAAKRRESDVRELYMWARAQVFEIGRAERDAARGADALRAFEDAAGKTRLALASRFAKEPAVGELAPAAAAATPSGPARSLAALREMVGLAKALCEAVEGRDRVRLQYVCAANALSLNRTSERARTAMIASSATSAATSDDFLATARAAGDAAVAAAPGEDGADDHKAAADDGAPAAAAAADARPDPESEAPREEDAAARALAAYGNLRQKVVTGAAGLHTKFAALELGQRVPERARLAALARNSAALAAAVGLRVASAAATGAARVSSSADDVARNEALVKDLAEAYDVADARLRADALKLKTKWDDLQVDAYDAFVRGESSRADSARANADGAALSLVHMKHRADEGAAGAAVPV